MKRAFVLMTALVFLVHIASGAVAWDNPSGSTVYFEWSNGHNQTGLFGNPTVISEDTFLFFPSQFRAEASDGATDTKSDTLTFDLHMKSPYCLGGIKVTEYGDFGILGPHSSVHASGQLFLENLGNGSVLATNLLMSPNFPMDSGSGTWSGHGTLNGTFCDSVRISVSNELVAVSSAGTTTFIEKKLLGSAIEITIIPEPTTLGLLSVGMFFLKRKMKP